MTQLVLFSEGCLCNTLVYAIGDWVRTRDGRIIEIATWPRIDEPDLARRVA